MQLLNIINNNGLCQMHKHIQHNGYAIDMNFGNGENENDFTIEGKGYNYFVHSIKANTEQIISFAYEVCDIIDFYDKISKIKSLEFFKNQKWKTNSTPHVFSIKTIKNCKCLRTYFSMPTESPSRSTIEEIRRDLLTGNYTITTSNNEKIKMQYNILSYNVTNKKAWLHYLYQLAVKTHGF